MEMEITVEQAEDLGTRTIDLLGLISNKRGYFSTDWGPKTREGLGRCIHQLTYEAFGLTKKFPNETDKEAAWRRKAEKML